MAAPAAARDRDDRRPGALQPRPARRRCASSTECSTRAGMQELVGEVLPAAAAKTARRPSSTPSRTSASRTPRARARRSPSPTSPCRRRRKRSSHARWRAGRDRASSDYRRGLLTEQEQNERIIELWQQTTAEVADGGAASHGPGRQLEHDGDLRRHQGRLWPDLAAGRHARPDGRPGRAASSRCPSARTSATA